MFPVRFETFSFPFHEFMVAVKVLFFVGQSSIMKLSNSHAKILKTLFNFYVAFTLYDLATQRNCVSYFIIPISSQPDGVNL